MPGKLNCLAGLVVLAIAFTIAQVQKTAGAELKAARFFLMSGKSKVDMNVLHSRLESLGLSKPSDSHTTLGVGGYGLFKDWLVGGEIHALLEREARVGIYQAAVSGGYGFLNLGYLVYSPGGLNVYPLLGIGGGQIRLKIDQLLNIPDAQPLDNRKARTELSSVSFLVNLGFGMDYLLKLREYQKGEAGLVLGLRAGYIFAPYNEGWEMAGIEVFDNPHIGIKGPYIHLMIGGGLARK